VRERGEILKIEILKKDYEGGVLIKFKEYAGSNVFKLKEIEKWKHSPNIIDVIEVGDIVEVFDVLHNDIIIVWHKEVLKALKEDIENGIQIKSIVTHESFNSIKYEVI
jgi:hypothetical protein